MSTRFLCRTLASILIVFLLLGGTAFFADEKEVADEPRTLKEKIDREVLRFRIQLINGKMRLEKGIVGMGGIEGDPTPFRLCCGSNLSVINKAIEDLHVLFDELNACYDEAGVSGGRASVEFARTDLANFERGLGGMADAPDKRNAQMYMGGMTRAFYLLLESVEALEPCGESELPAETKKKRKQKRSKKADQ